MLRLHFKTHNWESIFINLVELILWKDSLAIEISCREFPGFDSSCVEYQPGWAAFFAHGHDE